MGFGTDDPFSGLPKFFKKPLPRAHQPVSESTCSSGGGAWGGATRTAPESWSSKCRRASPGASRSPWSPTTGTHPSSRAGRTRHLNRLPLRAVGVFRASPARRVPGTRRELPASSRVSAPCQGRWAPREARVPLQENERCLEGGRELQVSPPALPRAERAAPRACAGHPGQRRGAGWGRGPSGTGGH